MLRFQRILLTEHGVATGSHVTASVPKRYEVCQRNSYNSPANYSIRRPSVKLDHQF